MNRYQKSIQGVIICMMVGLLAGCGGGGGDDDSKGGTTTIVLPENQFFPHEKAMGYMLEQTLRIATDIEKDRFLDPEYTASSYDTQYPIYKYDNNNKVDFDKTDYYFIGTKGHCEYNECSTRDHLMQTPPIEDVSVSYYAKFTERWQEEEYVIEGVVRDSMIADNGKTSYPNGVIESNFVLTIGYDLRNRRVVFTGNGYYYDIEKHIEGTGYDDARLVFAVTATGYDFVEGWIKVNGQSYELDTNYNTFVPTHRGIPLAIDLQFLKDGVAYPVVYSRY